MNDEKIVQFLRRRDYRLIKELGQGACGKTVLLFDDQIQESFVCKKYTPYSEEQRQELFKNFTRETKLLHQVYHENVVRVFNYYLYPEDFAGYILMEYVEGVSIDKYVEDNPEKINELFVQALKGFRYLEKNKILHRDIRVLNILVRKDGVLKIIDLGFGKQVKNSDDFDKSISLNLWCQPPGEFKQAKYNFQTEVYFVGQLFAQIIQENNIEDFKYESLLGKMCSVDPKLRIKNFYESENEIQSNRFYEIDFSEEEKNSYREFSNQLCGYISKIQRGATYRDDVEKIQIDLEDIYRKCMLEINVPDPAIVIRCFLNGSYYFKQRSSFSVFVLKEFLHLLKSTSIEKRHIILANLNTKIDAITRYKQEEIDDIPF